jgi:NADP-dependent aldehyde dehydrogenase
MSIVSYHPRTGSGGAQVAESSAEAVDATVQAAADAAPSVAAVPPAERARWLRALAEALLEARPRLVELADQETALGEERLTGEVQRTADQLRHYAEVAEEGSYLQATIDRGGDQGAGPGVDLRRVNVPLGPVAVFGASNFPFAFGVLGNDTASALAAGCPVVVKAHPAHPLLCDELRTIAKDAFAAAGAPSGVLGMVHGFAAGERLVLHPGIAAVGFTGSQSGGLALWRLAASREIVIPVYAEMGTVNPLIVTPEAARTRATEIAAGFVSSYTLGMGQYCTKPGLLLVPAGSGLAEATAAALRDAAPRGWLLTEAIANAYAAGVDRLVKTGARVLATTEATPSGWAAQPTLLAVTPRELAARPDMITEVFGPVALVCEYADLADLHAVLTLLPGSLAAAVHAGPGEEDLLRDLVSRLSRTAGRVVVNGYPTGVVVGWAQHHGGPWPATTAPQVTSVGAHALNRFTRPIAFQNVPDHALPPPLRDDNPWRIPRRVDGQWVPVTRVTEADQ